MRMTIKTLVAAVAVAATGAANAALDYNVANPELLFTIWDDKGTLSDTSDDVGYVRDLGLSLNQFASNAGNASDAPLASAQVTGTIFSVAADSNMTSFLAGASSLQNLHWNVATAESTGFKRVLVTIDTTTGALSTPTNTTLGGWVSDYNSYVSNVAALAGISGSANGSAIVAAADQAFPGQPAWSTNWNGRTAFSDATSFGAGATSSSLAFGLINQGGTTTSAISKAYMFKTTDGSLEQWTLSSTGDLAFGVSAVPEAPSSAMLLAGLGLVGLIARRRTAK